MIERSEYCVGELCEGCPARNLIIFDPGLARGY